MNISSVPELENIVAAKIAIEVCNKPDVINLSANVDDKLAYIFSFESNNKQWRKLQANVSRKISSLGLPKALQKKVNGLIKPILLEIEQWREDHCEVLCTYVDLQSNFSWDLLGTIDRKKTAQALIKLENYDIRNRFVLACFYFLEAEIRTLWQKLSFCYEETSVYDTSASLIVRFWVNRLKGHEMDLNYLASECVLYPPPDIFPRNALVFNSFINLLPATDKLQCLIFQINRRRINRNDMILCLSGLTEDEKIQIYRACAKNILMHFVNWPLQKDFLKMADTLWKYLSEKHFMHLLEFILRRRIWKEWSDYDYIELLKDFWFNSPDHLKEFIKEKSFYKLLMEVVNHDRTKPFPKERRRRRFLPCPVSFFNALRFSCSRNRFQIF